MRSKATLWFGSVSTASVSACVPSRLLSSLPRFSCRLWKHDSSVRRWKGLLHLLRSDRSPLHHVGADRLCPEAPLSSGRGSHRPPPPIGHEAPASHLRPLPPPAGSGDFGLLCGTGWHILHSGDVLVVSGRDLLLFRLALHHRPGGFGPSNTPEAAVQAALPDCCHG